MAGQKDHASCLRPHRAIEGCIAPHGGQHAACVWAAYVCPQELRRFVLWPACRQGPSLLLPRPRLGRESGGVRETLSLVRRLSPVCVPSLPGHRRSLVFASPAISIQTCVSEPRGAQGKGVAAQCPASVTTRSCAKMPAAALSVVAERAMLRRYSSGVCVLSCQLVG